ncbi:OsmC family protein [Agarivorans sp. 1_MG-2023]|uniref:OsmC family protein n=1 Tax=Agarivorans sp. 1_MG-2023 TaxID=3062634 RepID=UPI0026E21401|nr:OsmC family protein [Agarivorans sp. 1_MG-2023]MDO6764438.1 OsmC family protein [Agarivorans sp. 1_MG-2023]
MSKYCATIEWQRQEHENYTDNQYSRGHLWHFDGGQSVPASSSPHVVPLPHSVEANVDPEEAFVASLSSCHMLFFLSIAAKNRLVVNSYVDQAVGIMAMNEHGKMAMTEVILNPKVSFADKEINFTKLEKMHHQAHQQCFIANSVTTKITTHIVA